VVNSDIKLISDVYGDIIGSLFVPNNNPSFESGSKSFRITDSLVNSLTEGAASSYAETNFISAGSLINYQENIVGVEPRLIPPSPINNTTIASSAAAPQVQQPRPWQDGDIIIKGSNITNAEGDRLVNSINQKNGTSFTLSELKNAAGINQLNKVSELNRINSAARRLAGR
jgi:hypothetical protein